MKNIMILFLLLPLAVATMSFAAAMVNWQNYTDSKGGYSVSLPGDPYVTTNKKVHYASASIEADGNDIGFYVHWKAAKKLNGSKIQSEGEKFMNYFGIEKQSFPSPKSISGNGFTGYEYNYKSSATDVPISARIIYANGILYHLEVATWDGHCDQAWIDQFFNSFKLN